jgi:hypothetical protein
LSPAQSLETPFANVIIAEEAALVKDVQQLGAWTATLVTGVAVIIIGNLLIRLLVVFTQKLSAESLYSMWDKCKELTNVWPKG